MRELLPDNIALTERLSALPPGLAPPKPPGEREIGGDKALVTWISSFATYVAIVAEAHSGRVCDMLAYMRLIIREASKFGGMGWLTYDAIFRRNQEGLSSPWNSLDASLTLSNFSGGLYRYTTDLLALESASRGLDQVPYSTTLASVLQLLAWKKALDCIPDKAFTQFLMRGITCGFRIGVTEECRLRPSRRNLKSAYDHTEVVSEYLEREVSLSRLSILPPATSPVPLQLQISPFGVIPKKHRPDKWRLIVDLSSPEGYSVNDAISNDLCSTSYTSIDNAVYLARGLGKGCLLAKLDIKEAYRAVPVHPSDQRFLAVSWKGATYIDKALPFGLRSAPKLFSARTDAMMYILHCRGVETALHYLDDFLVLAPPGQQGCNEALACTLGLCEELGFPVAPEKTEGPTTTLTFLGIELDMAEGLPQEKLVRLQATITQWMKHSDHPSPRGSGKKRDLLSLIGLLSHAASVVRPGRAFLRSLIDAASTVQDLDHWVHLNSGARAGLAWWHTFIGIWNGTSFMPSSDPTIVIVSDASGSWGCGASYENLWFQMQWPGSWGKVSITPKELVPIVVAVILWGPYWVNRQICCLCDNAAVVAGLNVTLSAPSPGGPKHICGCLISQ